MFFARALGCFAFRTKFSPPLHIWCCRQHSGSRHHNFPRSAAQSQIAPSEGDKVRSSISLPLSPSRVYSFIADPQIVVNCIRHRRAAPRPAATPLSVPLCDRRTIGTDIPSDAQLLGRVGQKSP